MGVLSVVRPSVVRVAATVNIEFADAAQIRDAVWSRTRDYEMSE